MNTNFTPQEALKKHFGYDAFRLEQENIIHNVLAGKDTFVLMPTGGGKSICYQLPALMMDGLTVVVSPLIALMKDQVDALRANGVKAAYLNSTLTPEQQSQIIFQIRNGDIKILYLAPERLISDGQGFLDFLAKLKVSLVAIDEAHCISQWGHDFRPEYLKLHQLKKQLPNAPFIALTATADELTRKDILDKLKLENPQTFLSSFNRANIEYHVKAKQNSFEKLLDFLDARKDESGIIYTLSRKETESLSARLRAEGFNAKPYHAGLKREEREQNQDLFLRDEVKIIVATIAFGMGIDKSNVRFVVHMTMPKNIEGYYQETGRAGRDGLPSIAYLFYSSGDLFRLKGFAEVDGNEDQSNVMLQKLNIMAEYCETRSCRRKYLLNYFNEEASDNCGSCDVCLTELEMIDATRPAQMVLSAMVRLQSSFGMNYIVQVLRGSKAENIWDSHKGLKTYGAGVEHSKEEWNYMIKEFIREGYINRSHGQYPVLELNEKSWEVLKEGKKVSIAKPEVETANRELHEEQEALPFESDLLQDLKRLRKKIADEMGVPSFVVFSDATVLELATYLPQKEEDLYKISGFGEVKVDKYGFSFLEEINAYCRIHKLESRIDQKASVKRKTTKKKRKKKPSGSSDTKLRSFELHEQGMSMLEIAKNRDLNAVTIEGHLAHFVGEGKLSVHDFVTPEKRKPIEEAIEKLGAEKLAPLKEALGDSFSYGEIKMTVKHLEFLESKK